MKLLALALVIGSLTAGCQALTSAGQFQESVPRIIINKGPCFGRCPVFTMTVYDNRWVKYEGERFTQKEGIHYKRLDQLRYEQLIQAFENAKLSQFKRVYPATVQDLPTVRIIYYDAANNIQEVMGKDNRPEKVVELEELLDAVATAGGWTSASGEASPEGTAPDAAPRSGENEVIVQLNPNTDPRVWVIPYDRQGMRFIERIAPNRDYYLFSFDPNRVAPQQLLDMLRRSRDVLSAELNRSGVELRN